MKILRDWRKLLDGVEIAVEETEKIEKIPSSHDHIKNYEIVEPPPDGEDPEQAHGGDDACQDVADAPEREEASGEKPDGEQGSENESSSDSPSEDSDTDTDSEKEGDSVETEENSEEENPDPFADSEEEQSDGENEAEKSHGEINHREAFDLVIARRKRLAVAFSAIVSKIAEDLTGHPIPGDDEWDMQALMERRITHHPLASCRQSREKESIIIVLDTSGSCYAQAEFYASISQIAARLGDAEIYVAPNAGLSARWTPTGWERVENWQWPWTGRTIIFFGDFDGGNAPVEASRHNKIYWFSSEDRYADMDAHDWCSYTLADFRGKYYACTDENDFIRLLKKVR